VLKPNAPGRDPIVSRILWLNGLESVNSNAKRRYIYIHGTTEESRLGQPASYGCIRMGLKDVVDAFNEVNIGDKVVITKKHLPAGKAPPVVKEEEVKPAEVEALTPAVETEPAVLAAAAKPASQTAATDAPHAAPTVATAPASPAPSFFKRLFYGSKEAPQATVNAVAAAPEAVTAPVPIPDRGEAAVLQEPAQAPAAGESRSFLTRLLFGKKKSEPAAPVAPDAEPVGPEKPKDVAKQRAAREPRASKLSSARPQPVVAANSRA
jgi:hypothetical protein